MKQLLFTSLAESDLQSILEYVAAESPGRAVSFVGFLRKKAHLLVTQPELGRERTDLPGNYRSFPIGGYHFFYRITDSTVEVHRVIHGKRAVAGLLE